MPIFKKSSPAPKYPAKAARSICKGGQTLGFGYPRSSIAPLAAKALWLKHVAGIQPQEARRQRRPPTPASIGFSFTLIRLADGIRGFRPPRAISGELGGRPRTISDGFGRFPLVRKTLTGQTLALGTIISSTAISGELGGRPRTISDGFGRPRTFSAGPPKNGWPNTNALMHYFVDGHFGRTRRTAADDFRRVRAVSGVFRCSRKR